MLQYRKRATLKSARGGCNVKKVLFLVLLSFLALSVFGQTSHKDDWSDFVSVEGNNWKPHFQEGRLRSLYGQSRTVAITPDNVTGFLDQHARVLGIQRISDIRLESVEDNEIGTRYLYRQYYGGYKVVGGEVLVHTNKAHQIITVHSNYFPGLKGDLRYSRGEAQAQATAARYLGGNAEVTVGELMVYPMGTRARLVWRVEADSSVLSKGSYLMYVDAENPKMVLLIRKTHATFDGTGNIFLENPVVTPARTDQKLPNMDGSKKLAGKFAQIYDGNFVQDVNDPLILTDYTTASDAGRRYDYPANDPRLTEAMAYFHINKVHDRWRSFGFQKLNAKAPVFVNITATDGGDGYDNAFYTRQARFRTGIYVFGAGHIFENLGLDCDVYYHEYGHGVLDHQKPGLFEAQESNYPGSFHEGFGDISDAAITGNSKIGEFALRVKASKRFVGRNVANTNSFPRDVALPPTKRSEVHHTGLIIGGAWWDLRLLIGADQAQNILLKALSLMPNEMNYFDLRDAMITADNNLNGGANNSAIMNAFSKHGLGGTDPGQPGNINVTALKAGAFNFNTGKAQFKTTFKRGDTIVIVENYNASGLTPGYNVIPIDASVQRPPGTAPDSFLLLDEAVNGNRTANNGAFQAVFFTDSNSAKGQYTVSIQSRLGGSNQTTVKKTIKFKLN